MRNITCRVARKLALLRMRLSRNTRPSSAPYISGDTFRSIADHIHDETRSFDPHTLKHGDIVFVKSDMLDEYFTTVHPNIPHPYVLLTHNSDRNILIEDLAYMDSKIIHWFAQNAEVVHPKLTPLPIGLENAHYHMHGVVNTFESLKENTPAKIFRILFGFNISTNPKERQRAFDTLNALPLADSTPGYLIPKKYLHLLHIYGFVASPPGNGIDCHRTWEAMYLETIPIVKRSVCTKYFRSIGLPIWIIDDWTELESMTEDSLREKYRLMRKSGDLTPLAFDYWKDLIYSYRTRD